MTTRIDPTTLRSRLDEVELVDVRTPGEHEAGRLPGSRNRPLDELDAHLEELRSLAAEDRTLVLVCQSGARAEQARQRLTEAGLDDVRVLDGGVDGWQQRDGEVIEDVQRWRMERQVRLAAGTLVATSIAASTVWPPARYLAGAVGGGLVFSAVTDTCAMAKVLSKLPYNRPRNGGPGTCAA